MSTHNICLYKEIKKKYIDYTKEFLDCALIGACAVIRSVIRSNTVSNIYIENIR